MISKYRAQGFPVPGEEFRLIRGTVTQLKTALKEAIATMTHQRLSASRILQIPNEATIQNIAEFDKSILSFDRSTFLYAFFTFANGRAIVRSDEGTRYAWIKMNVGTRNWVMEFQKERRQITDR